MTNLVNLKEITAGYSINLLTHKNVCSAIHFTLGKEEITPCVVSFNYT